MFMFESLGDVSCNEISLQIILRDFLMVPLNVSDCTQSNINRTNTGTVYDFREEWSCIESHEIIRTLVHD